jgi:DNA invertase Pin-like site-specific DNA recombinase
VVALDLGIDLSTPAGEFMAGVMASAAQWERRIIGTRTREALAAKKATGARLGRPSSLPPEVRERIATERADGRTWMAIADRLNRDQVGTSQGGARWYPSSVRAVYLAAVAVGYQPMARL